MFYLADNGKFYTSIALTDSDNYSIRDAGEFFVLTISKDIQDDHLAYANQVLKHFRGQGVVFHNYPLDEAQERIMEQYRRNRDFKHSYFPLQFKSGPIPWKLIGDWDIKNVVEGIKIDEGWIPSIDCEWR